MKQKAMVSSKSNHVKKSLLIILLIYSQASYSQNIFISNVLKKSLKDPIALSLLAPLDSLFGQISNDSINKKYITEKNSDLTISILRGLTANGKRDSILNYFTATVIDLHQISKNKYSITVAYVSKITEIRTIFNLIAIKDINGITFSLPLQYLTRYWKSTSIGQIKYFYRDTINTTTAIGFNSKNHKISEKLGLPAEAFSFYICDNYQEILELLGFQFDASAIGRTRDGYGVDQGTIFSITGNEDFSHDIFHYYSGKVNKNENRNWITEEGIAYIWGNAYYTNSNGEMIEQQILIDELKKYLGNNKESDLLYMFENDVKIYNHLASELSVRAVISGLICNEIELKRGMKGIFKLINCGRMPDLYTPFFLTIEELAGINRNNFNEHISRLLERN
ncbi:MAG: hypothetical protein RIF39_14680 [Cyclobacteriaceae bacterium]